MLVHTPTADVFLDEVPVSALLDTGSPTSIVSLEFFLKAAAKKRTPEQTPTEWGKTVRARLQPTTVSLRSYGGNELQIVSQVRCRVARGNRTVDATLQVQKAAPVDLLLGTNVLSQLGFALLQTKQNPSDNLLSYSSLPADPPKCSVSGQETATPLSQTSTPSDLVLPTPSSPHRTRTASVRLIQAVRLPGRHSKLIQADVQDVKMDKAALLFQPDQGILRTKGIVMADTIVMPGKTVTLFVNNFGCEPVQLERGEVIGQLEAATVIDRRTRSARQPQS